jgi:hypothetical protein
LGWFIKTGKFGKIEIGAQFQLIVPYYAEPINIYIKPIIELNTSTRVTKGDWILGIHSNNSEVTWYKYIKQKVGQSWMLLNNIGWQQCKHM